MSRTSFLVIGFSNNESKANEKSLTAHILWVAQLSSTLNPSFERPTSLTNELFNQLKTIVVHYIIGVDIRI